MKTIAETLGVARSNLYDRLQGTTHARGRYHRRGDAELLARITRLVTARPMKWPPFGRTPKRLRVERT